MTDKETIKSLEETIRKLTEAIAEQPERKRGRWIGNSRHQSCSACQMTYCIPDGESGTMDMTGYHFCPNCGAQMESEEEKAKNKL